MKRTLIKELEEEKESIIKGHITKIRDTKYMFFIILEDRSGSIQVSIEKENNEEMCKKLEGVFVIEKNIILDKRLTFNLSNKVLGSYATSKIKI